MQKLTLGDVVMATKGLFLRGSVPKIFSGISTDTRLLIKGDFFIPLVGKRFDGHAFLADAMAAGASGCVLAAGWKGKTNFLGKVPVDFGIIEVPDTNVAFCQIAAYYRNLFFDLSVVGVTGSNGKSTTKEMIAAVLAPHFQTLKNEGTLNNLIGVPQTLLRLEWDTRIAVLEMGTSLSGEIAALTTIAHPNVGVLTNIGPSHLEFFGDLDGVAKEKGALAEGLSEQGLFVVNADDPKAWAVRSRTRAKVVGFGFGPDAQVRASDPACSMQGHWGFDVSLVHTGERARIQWGILGKHNIPNALAAIAVGSHYGISLAPMKAALESFRGLKMRVESSVLHGIRIINDAYNSNPQSFGKALEALEDCTGEGRKIVVMGDMLELGAGERQAHEQAGRAVAFSRATIFVAVGRRAGWAAEVFRHERGNAAQQTFAFENVANAAGFLSEIVQSGDVLLLKGSRGMRLETILENLTPKGVACS